MTLTGGYSMADRASRGALATIFGIVGIVGIVDTAYSGERNLVPAGLEVGDGYHLLFASSTCRDALSGDPADYDAHVQAAADVAGIGASVGISWTALVSYGDTKAPQVDARDRLVVGESTPVFNRNLEPIASGFADLWDGSITTPVVDEYGDPVFRDAWTGSSADGTADPAEYLGSNTLTAWCGNPSMTDTNWFHFLNPPKTICLRVFAISEELRVEPSKNEPPSFLRGDVDGSGNVPGSTTDIVALASFLFLGQDPPDCLAAADINGDGKVPGSTTDIVYLAGFLFLGGQAPPAPGPRECGLGNDADRALGCQAHVCLE